MGEIRGPEGREGQPGREGVMGREGPPGIDGSLGPQGIEGPIGKSISKPIKSAFVIMILIFFLTVVGFSALVIQSNSIADDTASLVLENQKRIVDIQNARLLACGERIEVIRLVITPFFDVEIRTKKQQEDFVLFNTTIKTLKHRCVEQIKLKKKAG